MNENKNAIQSIEYISVGTGQNMRVQSEIVSEILSCISVNGSELATFMCSPNDLDLLAIGFLFNEGLIQSMEEVRSIHLSKSSCVDIWIDQFDAPKRKIITAGCGGGVTFDDLSKKHKPLNSNIRVKTETLADIMRQMQLGAAFYQRSRGIHTAGLSDGEKILLQVEDVGRHNCLDKLAGKALREGVKTSGNILLSSGRISSEMINKARRLETPIICSRTSPTSLSVALANTWNITIVAYLRQNRMRIYTHPERVLSELPVLRVREDAISGNGDKDQKGDHYYD